MKRNSYIYIYIILTYCYMLIFYCQAAVSVKISNLFVSVAFDLSCPILEKDNFINNLSY